MSGLPPAAPRIKWLRDERADAPIVGVILMVAIVVVISAGAFIAWKIMAGDPDPTPAFGLRVDEPSDRLVVVGTEDRADWGRIVIGVESQEGPATAIYMGTADPYQNDGATVNGANVLTATRRVSESAARINAPDFLEFCADLATTHVDVVVIDHVSNARIGTWRFINVDAC